MSDIESPIARAPILPLSVGHSYESIDGPSKTRRYCAYATGALFSLAIIVGIVLAISYVPASASAEADAPAAAGEGQTASQQPAPSGGFKSSSFAAASSASCSLSSGTSTLHSGGFDRTFELYIPNSAKPDAPLALIWHGIASSPSKMEKKMLFKPAADKNGFILAYPVGTGIPKGFNGAGCCSEQIIGEEKDDVQFGRDIISHIEQAGCINPNNVFSTGFSNGGFMTHRMGCESGLRPDGKPWIKAIAPHSALMGSLFTCNPGRPIPVLSFHGTDDKVVGFDGAGLGSWISFYQTMKVWAEIDGCQGDRIEQKRSASTTCYNHNGCTVEYCVVEGGLGHNWSGDPALDRPDDLKATDLVMQFFESFLE